MERFSACPNEHCLGRETTKIENRKFAWQVMFLEQTKPTLIKLIKASFL
jgi:hypothetical protein